MACAASISLVDVLERFYHSPDRVAHIHCQDSLPILQHLHIMAFSMRDFDFDEVRPSDGESLKKQIRDALWRAEDVVESYWLSLLHSSEDDMDIYTNPSNFSQDIQEVVQEIESGMERMKKFAHDHKPDSIPLVASFVLSSNDDSRPRNKIVGLDEELGTLKRIVFGQFTGQRLGAVVIHGMGGIGKTLLATTFYNDSDVRNYFSIGAWVKISLPHCVRDILLSLLNTMQVFDQNISDFGLVEDNISDEGLANIVHERLANKRYVVVVDCLCEININSWNYMKSILPDSNNDSRIVLVNRLNLHDNEIVFCNFEKRLMDALHSWELLREKVFGDEPFPHVFERLGKRIAKNCQGLPLAIITVGSHLAKEEKTVEYWNKIADSGNSLAYAADGSPMFERLGLSYRQISQFFRPLFLYLATFRERHDIIFPEIMDLWIAEGFVGPAEYKVAAALTSLWINYFANRNLIFSYDTDSGTAFSLHHTLWHMCRIQSKKDEFFHVMNMMNDWEDFPASTNANNVRRLVVSKNVLLGIHDIFKSEDSVLSSTRSILLTDLGHQYPLTINWGMYKMLRVLHARSIYFYEFPTEILSLSLLRYLALALKRVVVPPGISRLRNLQFLLVLSPIKVSFRDGPSYLPMEIWEMQQLIDLHVHGNDLPIPTPHSDAQLPNLSTLWGVSPHSCTKEVLERIPNIVHLGILINVAPKRDVDTNHMRPFNHLALLKHLDLCLHAFRGPKWKLSNKRFKRLKTLVMEDLDVVYWTARSGEFFPCLRQFRITRCHKLQQIPSAFKRCPDLKMIEVEDCSREVEAWARSIQMERSPTGSRYVLVSSPRGKSSSMN